MFIAKTSKFGPFHTNDYGKALNFIPMKVILLLLLKAWELLNRAKKVGTWYYMQCLDLFGFQHFTEFTLPLVLLRFSVFVTVCQVDGLSSIDEKTSKGFCFQRKCSTLEGSLAINNIIYVFYDMAKSFLIH